MEVSGQHVPAAVPRGKKSVSGCRAGPTAGLEILQDTKYVAPAGTGTQPLGYSLH
jgi:hypothetical protein